MKNKAFRCIGGLALGLLLAGQAAAYYGGTFSWSDPGGGYADWSRARMYQQTVDYNRKLAQRYSSRSSGKNSDKGSDKKEVAPKPKLNPSAYEYQPSAAVSAAVMEDFLNEFHAHAQKNGADAQTLADIRAMRNWGAMDLMRQQIKANGLPPDSLATAMTLWLAVNYGAIHQHEGTEKLNSGLYTQLRAAMSEDKTVLAMNDEQKQRAAEGMLWMTFVQIYAQAKLENDPQGRSEAAKLARQSLKSGGIDPDLMHITKNGLELK
ncbi:hypothetical protein EII19_10640 [Comamonadaceae bacterium OH2310_COT-174]|nr:hypothetical protein EII19_10640 [Comamonadaceae bacterium OH2310_COT-174]